MNLSHFSVTNISFFPQNFKYMMKKSCISCAHLLQLKWYKRFRGKLLNLCASLQLINKCCCSTAGIPSRCYCKERTSLTSILRRLLTVEAVKNGRKIFYQGNITFCTSYKWMYMSWDNVNCTEFQCSAFPFCKRSVIIEIKGIM